MMPSTLPWLLLVIHSLCCLMMTGIIWFVQISQYPLFHTAGVQMSHEGFRRFIDQHMRLTTYVVAPLMLAEATCAVALLYLPPSQVAYTTLLIWCGLELIIWAATAFLSVPCHHQLQTAYDHRVAERLIQTNWVRTVAWSVKTLVLAYSALSPLLG